MHFLVVQGGVLDVNLGVLIVIAHCDANLRANGHFMFGKVVFFIH